jgi:hypothetical protein
MAKHRIFTIGFDLPEDDFEAVDFDSDQTLLDADIIFFQPTLGAYTSFENYAGLPLLSDDSSFEIQQRIEHWRTEIVGAVKAGKLVIVYLAKPVECYRYTGTKEFSGTGRSRVTTKIVVPISSYAAIPNVKGATAKTGTEIRLARDAGFIAPYWSEFSTRSACAASIA